MARDDLIQATGSVEKVLGGGRYQITLEAGQTVRRYGEIIGAASRAIQPGEHIHTHNLRMVPPTDATRSRVPPPPTSPIPQPEQRNMAVNIFSFLALDSHNRFCQTR